MGLYEIKMLLYTEGQNSPSTHFIGRVNKQPTEREHIFASYTPEKKFMSIIYKEWKQMKYYKGKLPINKYVSEMDSSQKKKLKWLMTLLKGFAVLY